MERSNKICIKPLLIAVYIIALTVSCNPENWELVNCDECYTSKPSEALINVKLSISNLNPEVIINVYNGKIEEENLLLSETVNKKEWSIYMPANKYYTVTATYRAHTGNFYVTAIDGGLVRTIKVRSVCDKACWVIRGGNYNVRLKN